MRVYAENPTGSIKKIFNLTSEFSKIPGYKVNIQMTFLHTNNEIPETEMRGKKAHLLQQQEK